MNLDPLNQAIIEATQSGLPIVPTPYKSVADSLGISEDELICRIASLKKQGIVRRIGAAANHYRMGLVANGMTVWDVDDKKVDELGEQVGALEFVTHCYRRPRALPDWTFNLFAMVHGKNRDEVFDKKAKIETILGSACVANDILFSTRILKKTGLRLSKKGK